MPKNLSGDAIFKVIEQPHCSGDRTCVASGAEKVRRLLDGFRRLVFREDSDFDQLAHQSDKDRTAEVTKFVRATASEHKRSPRFGVVHCDEAGNLYRIDRATDQYVPLVSRVPEI